MAASTSGLWNLHAGWLKVSPGKQGFEGYKKDVTVGASPSESRKWKDRWGVINSNKVCLFLDERCIQETAVFAIGPEAVVRMWEPLSVVDEMNDGDDDGAEGGGASKWKTKSITGLHIRERLARMSQKKEVQKTTALNEILHGAFQLRDANGLLLVAKPKSFSSKECELWVENIKHAITTTQREVRMQGWVLAPEVKTTQKGKAELEVGIEKDIVLHAVAHSQPKKTGIAFLRKSSVADQEAKWFCVLKGKVLQFFADEMLDESTRPISHTMTISAFTRVEAAGNLKFGIFTADSR